MLARARSGVGLTLLLFAEHSLQRSFFEWSVQRQVALAAMMLCAVYPQVYLAATAAGLRLRPATLRGYVRTTLRWALAGAAAAALAMAVASLTRYPPLAFRVLDVAWPLAVALEIRLGIPSERERPLPRPAVMLLATLLSLLLGGVVSLRQGWSAAILGTGLAWCIMVLAATASVGQRERCGCEDHT